jgi:hypothetical protein
VLIGAKMRPKVGDEKRFQTVLLIINLFVRSTDSERSELRQGEQAGNKKSVKEENFIQLDYRDV